MNHNKILGVSHDASSSDIQRAFRAAAMEIHPDHNNSAEAAEAFDRIKKARDALLEKAKEVTPQNDPATVQAATDAAIRATMQAAYSSPAASPPVFDDSEDMTAEERAHIQELDRLATQFASLSRTQRRQESEEARRHRKRLETINQRISGIY